MAGLLDMLLGSSPAIAATDPTTVSGVDVNPAPHPQLVAQAPSAPIMNNQPSINPNLAPAQSTIDYGNTPNVQAVNSANSANPPQGGSDNPGMYGLLPQNLQHGTMRNILGALGDAFLVGSGRQAQYEPRMQRQEIGNAMAGMDMNDPQSMQAAIQRVAATGAPGAAEMADKLQANYESLQARKLQMEYNQQYRQQMIGSKNDSIFQRGAPVAMGVAASAKDANDYASKYAILDRRAKAIDPNSDAASAFGVPSPEEWQPGMFAGYGMTTNNQQVSTDKAAQRASAQRNTDVGVAGRIQAAGISAGAHVDAANISAGKPSSAATIDALTAKQNSGQQLTPAEQAVWNKATTISGRGRRAAPGATAPQSNYINGAVYTGKDGSKARYVNGHWYDYVTGHQVG